MAAVFYATDRTDGGDSNARVYTGVATQSKEIEIQITTGVGVTRKDAALYVMRLARYIAEEDTASLLTG